MLTDTQFPMCHLNTSAGVDLAGEKVNNDSSRGHISINFTVKFLASPFQFGAAQYY